MPQTDRERRIRDYMDRTGASRSMAEEMVPAGTPEPIADEPSPMMRAAGPTAVARDEDGEPLVAKPPSPSIGELEQELDSLYGDLIEERVEEMYRTALTVDPEDVRFDMAKSEDEIRAEIRKEVQKDAEEMRETLGDADFVWPNFVWDAIEAAGKEEDTETYARIRGIIGPQGPTFRKPGTPSMGFKERIETVRQPRQAEFSGKTRSPSEWRKSTLELRTPDEQPPRPEEEQGGVSRMIRDLARGETYIPFLGPKPGAADMPSEEEQRRLGIPERMIVPDSQRDPVKITEHPAIEKAKGEVERFMEEAPAADISVTQEARRRTDPDAAAKREADVQEMHEGALSGSPLRGSWWLRRKGVQDLFRAFESGTVLGDITSMSIQDPEVEASFDLLRDLGTIREDLLANADIIESAKAPEDLVPLWPVLGLDDVPVTAYEAQPSMLEVIEAARKMDDRTPLLQELLEKYDDAVGVSPYERALIRPEESRAQTRKAWEKFKTRATFADLPPEVRERAVTMESLKRGLDDHRDAYEATGGPTIDGTMAHLETLSTSAQGETMFGWSMRVPFAGITTGYEEHVLAPGSPAQVDWLMQTIGPSDYIGIRDFDTSTYAGRLMYGLHTGDAGFMLGYQQIMKGAYIPENHWFYRMVSNAAMVADLVGPGEDLALRGVTSAARRTSAGYRGARTMAQFGGPKGAMHGALAGLAPETVKYIARRRGDTPTIRDPIEAMHYTTEFVLKDAIAKGLNPVEALSKARKDVVIDHLRKITGMDEADVRDALRDFNGQVQTARATHLDNWREVLDMDDADTQAMRASPAYQDRLVAVGEMVRMGVLDSDHAKMVMALDEATARRRHAKGETASLDQHFDEVRFRAADVEGPSAPRGGGMAEGGPVRARVEDVEALRSTVRGILEDHNIPDVDVALEAVIPTQDGGTAGGAYDPRRNLISIALDQSSGTALAEFHHEIIHALGPQGMRLIDKAEWKVLERRAKKWRKDFGIDKRYAADLDRLGDAALNEEAIADAYKAWRRGELQVEGVIATLFQRIKEFFEALGNAIRGQGFQTAADVFGRIERGDVGRRGRDPGKGGRGMAYSRRAGDPDPLILDDPEPRRLPLRDPFAENMPPKPKRVVGLKEFSAAVVPGGVKPEARKVLDDAGLKVYEYVGGDNEGRLAAIRKASEEAGVLFSRRADPAQRLPVDDTPEEVGPLRLGMRLDDAEDALAIHAGDAEHAVVFDADERQVGRFASLADPDSWERMAPDDRKAMESHGFGPNHPRAKSLVMVSRPLAKASKESGQFVYTHYHPSGGGFSSQDIQVALRMNIREMRAVTEAGTFIMRRDDGATFWQGEHDLGEVGRIHDRVVRRAGDVARTRMDKIVTDAGGTPGDSSTAGYDEALWRQFNREAYADALEDLPRELALNGTFTFEPATARADRLAQRGDRLEQRERGAGVRYSRRADPATPDFDPADPLKSAAFRRWFGDSKVVDEAGKPLVVYHGTPRAGFGEFDPGASDRGFVGMYFTSNRGMAEGYEHGGGRRRASSGEVPFFVESIEQLERDVEGIEITRGDPLEDDFQFRLEKDGDDIGEFDDEAELLKYVNEYPEHIFTKGAGTYAVYLKMEMPWVIDAKGANWDSIEFDGDVVSTWDLDKMARDAGADGIIIQNVADNATDTYETGDVYVVFDPTQIKSVHNRGTFDPDDPRILFSKRVDPAWRDDAPRLADDLKVRHGLEHLDASTSPTADVLAIHRIQVPEAARGQGRADAALGDLAHWADERGVTLAMTPDTTWGADRARLERWYGKHGFKLNQGRAKDFRTQEGMTRAPRLGDEIRFSRRDESAIDRQNRVNAARDFPENLLTNVHTMVPERYMRQIPWQGEDTVTVYRSVPEEVGNEIRPGDWVALDREYAERHGRGKVLSMEVPARHVYWAGTDMNEWFYTPVDEVVRGPGNERFSRRPPGRVVQPEEWAERANGIDPTIADRLVVQHNIDAGALEKAIRSGGLIGPSLAVAKVAHPVEGFGEIVLLADKRIIDPAAGVPVFDADIYSPTTPGTTTKVQDGAVQQMLDGFMNDVGGGWPIIEAGTGTSMLDQPVARAAYLKEIGHQVPEPDEFNRAPTDPAIQAILDDPALEQLSTVPSDEIHLLGVEYPDIYAEVLRVAVEHGWRGSVAEILEAAQRSGPSGALTVDEAFRVVNEVIKQAPGGLPAYHAWLAEKRATIPRRDVIGGTDIEATVDNMLATMREWRLRGGENAGGTSPDWGSIRAQIARQFDDLEQVGQRREQIDSGVHQADRDDFSASVKRFIGDVNREVRTYHIDEHRFREIVAGAVDDIIERGGGVTTNDVARLVADDLGIAGNVRRGSFQGRLQHLLETLQSMSTDYFEAKLLRQVPLDEFEVAVVPEHLVDVSDALLDAGLDVVVYGKSGATNPMAARDPAIAYGAVRANVLFSRRAFDDIAFGPRPDERPVGLYDEDISEAHRLVTTGGSGLADMPSATDPGTPTPPPRVYTRTPVGKAEDTMAVDIGARFAPDQVTERIVRGGDTVNERTRALYSRRVEREVEVDQTGRYLYHSTLFRNMDDIAAEGLDPERAGATFGNYAFNTEGRVFLAEPTSAREWFGKVQDRGEYGFSEDVRDQVGVMLRVQREGLDLAPDDVAINEGFEGSVYTADPVDPGAIEFWHPSRKEWVEIGQWDEDLLDEAIGRRTREELLDEGYEAEELDAWEWEGDEYRSDLWRQLPDQFDEGGFKPGRDEVLYSRRERTPEFQAWSRGLPVIDGGEPIPDGGAIVRAYHGTTADFDAFETEGPPIPDYDADEPGRAPAGDSNAYLGAHFTGDPATASGFAGYGKVPSWLKERIGRDPEGGSVIPAHLRMENPLRATEDELTVMAMRQEITDDGVLEETFRRQFDLDDEDLDDAWTRYSEDVDFREDVNRQALDVAADMDAMGEGGLRESLLGELGAALKEDLVEQGYDSVVYPNAIEGGGDSYIVFNPQQVKGIFNPRPTEDPRIMYSRRQTETPAFRRWFGDSKVVDEQGEPLVVYHGTDADFEAFDPELAGTQKYSDWGRGIYLTPRKANADYYRIEAVKNRTGSAYNRAFERWEELSRGTKSINGAPQYSDEAVAALRDFQRIGREMDETTDGRVMPLYVRMERPLRVRGTGMPDPGLAERARARGHDGIIVMFEDGGIDELVVFSPEQIKSATGNRGTFDPDDPRITFSRRDDRVTGAFYGTADTGTQGHARWLLEFFQGADWDTFAHEYGHLLHELVDADGRKELAAHFDTVPSNRVAEIRRRAAAGETPEQIAQDLGMRVDIEDMQGPTTEWDTVTVNNVLRSAPSDPVLSRLGMEQAADSVRRYLEMNMGRGGQLRSIGDIVQHLREVWWPFRKRDTSLSPEVRRYWDSVLRPDQLAQQYMLGVQGRSGGMDYRVVGVDAGPEMPWKREVEKAGKAREAARVPARPEELLQAMGLKRGDQVALDDLVSKVIANMVAEEARTWMVGVDMQVLTPRTVVPKARVPHIQKMARERLATALGGVPEELLREARDMGTHVVDEGARAGDASMTLTPGQQAGMRVYARELASEPISMVGDRSLVPERFLDPNADLSTVTFKEMRRLQELALDAWAGVGARRWRKAENVSTSAASAMISVMGRVVPERVKATATDWFVVQKPMGKYADPQPQDILERAGRRLGGAQDWFRNNMKAQRALLPLMQRWGIAGSPPAIMETLKGVAKQLSPPIATGAERLDVGIVDTLYKLTKQYSDGIDNVDHLLRTHKLDAIYRSLDSWRHGLSPEETMAMTILEHHRGKRAADLTPADMAQIEDAMARIAIGLDQRMKVVDHRGQELARILAGSKDANILVNWSRLWSVRTYKAFYDGKWVPTDASPRVPDRWTLIDIAARHGLRTGPELQATGWRDTRISRKLRGHATYNFDMNVAMTEMITRLRSLEILGDVADELVEFGFFGIKPPDVLTRDAYFDNVVTHLGDVVEWHDTVVIDRETGRLIDRPTVSPGQDTPGAQRRELLAGPPEETGFADPDAVVAAEEMLDRWGFQRGKGVWEATDLPDGRRVILPTMAKDWIEKSLDEAANIGTAHGSARASTMFGQDVGSHGGLKEGWAGRFEDLLFKVADIVPGVFSRMKVGAVVGILVPNVMSYTANLIDGQWQLYQVHGILGVAKQLRPSQMRLVGSMMVDLYGEGRTTPRTGGILVTKDGRIYSKTELVRLAKEHGLDSSFVQAESARALVDDVRREHRGILSRMTILPFEWWQDQLINSYTSIDNWARCHVFINELRNGAAPEKAAAQARLALYDYSRLTDAEKRYARQISWFYAYERANQTLFWWTFLNHPSRVAGQVRLVRDLQQDHLGEEWRLTRPRFNEDQHMVGYRALFSRGGTMHAQGVEVMPSPLQTQGIAYVTRRTPAIDGYMVGADIYETGLSLLSNQDAVARTAARLPPWFTTGIAALTRTDPWSLQNVDASNYENVPMWYIAADKALGGHIVDDLLHVRIVREEDPGRQPNPGVPYRWAIGVKKHDDIIDPAWAWFVIQNMGHAIPGQGRSIHTITVIDRAFDRGPVEHMVETTRRFSPLAKPRSAWIPETLEGPKPGMTQEDHLRELLGLGKPVPVSTWQEAYRRGLKEEVGEMKSESRLRKQAE